jgi:1,2-diacylglycerol 3-beta-glucosyltransferase
MSDLVGGALLVLGIPGAIAALHVTVLSVASLWFRETRQPSVGTRFLVIVPARNEGSVIGDTVDALAASMRDRDTLIVVADRCTDDTAEVAASRGVNVLERGQDERPGRAAAISAGLESAHTLEWDAVVMVDADSVVGPGFFDALDGAYGAGAEAAQPRSEHSHRSGLAALLSEAAFAFQQALDRGRARLGLSVRLRGSGMSLSRDLATQTSFSTEGVSEDLFYTLDLLLAGHKVRRVESARVDSLPAHDLSTMSTQRTRWEVGRLAAARRYAVPLLAARTPSTLEAATYVLTPPLAVAVFLLLGAAVGGWLVGAGWLVALCVALVVAVGVDVVIALIEARASSAVWLSLLAAPAYVVWKAWVQLKALLSIGRAHEAYESTPRE